MPQGGRKVPFSGKQKKQQIQEKRLRKAGGDYAPVAGKQRGGLGSRGGRGRHQRMTSSSAASDSDEEREFRVPDVKKINVNQKMSSRTDASRYCLQFATETSEELKARREESLQPFESLLRVPSAITLDFDDDNDLDLPKRPPWSHSMSREVLEARENKYFREFVDDVFAKHPDISFFELNLETWRQLWRVLEMSDIVALVADIRFPPLHMPMSLYRHVTEDLKKDIILVLNKIDLVPWDVTASWIDFFAERMPQLRVVPFASYAGCKEVNRRGKRGMLHMAKASCLALAEACKEIVKNKVDLSSWTSKIHDDCDGREFNEVAPSSVTTTQPADASYYQADRYAGGVLTLGMVGHPNVGKSSVMNALMGKKVVSVSRTPGHTKHFQTIFLTREVRLCDCPGLVFPTRHPKMLQVLSGSYPIAQLREPYSSVKYLAQRVDLPKILRLKLDDDETSWSAYGLCAAWAEKRGFLTAKSGRPDVYRAANHLLRMALDGRTICLSFKPPHFYPPPPTHPAKKQILEMLGKSEEEVETSTFLTHSTDPEDLSWSEEDEAGESGKEDEAGESGKGEEGGGEEEEDSDTTAATNNKFALLMAAADGDHD